MKRMNIKNDPNLLPFRVIQYDFDGKFGVKCDGSDESVYVLIGNTKVAYVTYEEALEAAKKCKAILTEKEAKK
jgi:hypothetical protein